MTEVAFILAFSAHVEICRHSGDGFLVAVSKALAAAFIAFACVYIARAI